MEKMTTDEAIATLRLGKFGVKTWNERRASGVEAPDLSRVSLRNLDAPDVDFRGMTLFGVDLAGSNLSGADFGGSDLTAADLSDCSLIGANFSRANCRFASFRRANLSHSLFSGTKLQFAYLVNVKTESMRIETSLDYAVVADFPLVSVETRTLPTVTTGDDGGKAREELLRSGVMPEIPFTGGIIPARDGKREVQIVWSPEAVTPELYAELVHALGDLVRAAGGVGVERIRSMGVEVGAKEPAAV